MPMIVRFMVLELARMCRPNVRVILNVGVSHLENFASLNEVSMAKGERLRNTIRGDICVLNADDHLVTSLTVPVAVKKVGEISTLKLLTMYYLGYGINNGVEAPANYSSPRQPPRHYWYWRTYGLSTPNPVPNGAGPLLIPLHFSVSSLSGTRTNFRFGSAEIQLKTDVGLSKALQMGSQAVEDLIEASSGVHYSGFHLDNIESSTSEVEQPTTSTTDTTKQPFVIGVAGGAASGKTTVCDLIIEQLRDQRVVLVNQDSFYQNLTPEELKRVHEYNFDHPDAFDTEQLLCIMDKLKHGQAVDISKYDFKSYKNNVFPARRVNPSDVIILEGILIFHDPRVRDLMNMKIFVDTDADVRLARRIRRDTAEKGRDIGMVLDQYSKFVKPAFDDFILPTKKHADIIIPRGGDNHVAIDLIVQHIRTKLGQHDLCKVHPNLYVIQSTFQIRGMHTLIRDAQTTKHDFVFYSDRLIRLVVEHGLGHLPFTEKQVITPTGSVYTGVDFRKRLCGVSVIRSGESMENALRACCKGIKIGKILIHREGDNGQQLIYEKLPNDISDRHVLLLDPILGTGNSAVQAISLLIKKGVPESNIIFLNLISAPQGVHVVCKHFPRIKIVTSEIEIGLNEDYRVIPGMGEFGDRYFGTDDD
ncbi:Uridine kinase-like protein 4 [Abeliophyllum distichum]|uniref:Uridine kinase n=1 Tax=Abeliophyllum distichum TaxID=126358 RepID=A0ABD1UFI8_9LAMI